MSQPDPAGQPVPGNPGAVPVPEIPAQSAGTDADGGQLESTQLESTQLESSQLESTDAESTQLEPTQPAATETGLSQPAYLSDPTAPGQPGYPSDPTAPGQPGYPSDPTAPGSGELAGHSAAPADPAAPGYPTAPTDPAAPGYLTASADPAAPGYPTAPAYPAAPGYPTAPAYPSAGYQLPGDPLVTTPAEGFSGWFSRLFRVIGQQWRSLFAISLVTTGLPVAVGAVVMNLFAPVQSTRIDAQGNQVPAVTFPHPVAFVVVLLVVLVLGGLLSALAQGALVWTITRRAVDAPAPLGDALRYGLRNTARLWGWSLAYGVLVTVGICACVLPGLYLALAGCLYVPIALYQRGESPLSGSFSLVNKNFGAALGRMALLLVMLLGAQIVLQIPVRLVSSLVSSGAGQVLAFVVSLIQAPLTLVVTVGAVLLFAELRARQHPLTSADLNASL